MPAAKSAPSPRMKLVQRGASPSAAPSSPFSCSASSGSRPFAGRAQTNGGGGGAQQGNSVAVTVAVRAPTPAEARRTLDNIQVQVDATIGRRLAQDDAAGRFTLPVTDEAEVQEQEKA